MIKGFFIRVYFFLKMMHQFFCESNRGNYFKEVNNQTSFPTVATSMDIHSDKKRRRTKRCFQRTHRSGEETFQAVELGRK